MSTPRPGGSWGTPRTAGARAEALGIEPHAKIVRVRPDLVGAQVYGPGVDTSTRLIQDAGAIHQLDIIDVPYPNR